MSTRRPLVCPAPIAALPASPAPASTTPNTMARDRLKPEDIHVLYRPSPMRRPAHATAAEFAISATRSTGATRVDLAVLNAVAGIATAFAITWGTWLEAPIWAHDLERTAVTLTIESDGRF